jgi:hypothetical protein
MNMIRGYGAIEKFDLDTDNEEIARQVKSFNVEPGEFIKRYELSKSGGGNILTLGASLQGAMYEFDNAFMIIWSCGEYIDVAVVKKEQE